MTKETIDNLVKELRHEAGCCPDWWKQHSIYTRTANALESLSAELESARTVVEAARKMCAGGSTTAFAIIGGTLHAALAAHDTKHPRSAEAPK